VCDASAAAADAGDADDVAMATTRCDDEIDASELPVHMQLGAHLPSLRCDDDDDDDGHLPVHLQLGAPLTSPRCDNDDDDDDLPVHLQLGAQLTFSITLLQATGLPQHCTDVFAQFKSVSHIADAQSSVVIQLNVTAADLATPEGCKAEWTWAAQ